MKQYIFKSMFVLLFLFVAAGTSVHAQYGFGTNSIDPSAVVEMKSANKAFLPPRMTSAQMALISNPAEGLMVYNTDQHCMMYYTKGIFKCTYNNTTANQGTIVVGDKAPTYSSLTNSATYPYDGVTAISTLGSYQDDDPQGTPIYQWYRYDDSNGVVNKVLIPGANASTYKLTAADGGKYVGVSVVPVATAGTSPGAEIFAKPLGPVWTCGMDLTISHVAGAVAPETKLVTYKTKTSTITGSSRCWILQNLGATNSPKADEIVATSLTTGWFWQYGKAKGYKLNNDGTITPAWSKNSYSGAWPSTADPCLLLLGDGWKLPQKNLEWAKTSGLTMAQAWSKLSIGPGPYLASGGVVTNSPNKGVRYWSGEYNPVVMYSKPYEVVFDELNSTTDMLSSNNALQLRCLR